MNWNRCVSAFLGGWAKPVPTKGSSNDKDRMQRSMMITLEGERE
jgi:hypothetical protein